MDARLSELIKSMSLSGRRLAGNAPPALVLHQHGVDPYLTLSLARLSPARVSIKGKILGEELCRWRRVQFVASVCCNEEKSEGRRKRY